MEKTVREFKDDSTEAWYVVGKIFIALFAIAAIVFWFFGEKITHGRIACTMLLLLHMYCPGCGCTRAFNHLVHFRIWESFLSNPFVLSSLAMYVVFMVNTFLCHHTKKIGFTGFPVTRLVYADLIILMIQWVIRNVLYVGFGLTVL